MTVRSKLFRQLPEPPGWVSAYQLPGERKLREAREGVAANIRALEKDLSNLSDQLSALTEPKLLLYADGDALEGAVRDALCSIGFAIESTATDNRADAVAIINDTVCTIEVKGKKGSAAERDALQLLKWVGEIGHERNLSPKGILIINAYKDDAPDKRSEAFPHQMRKTCERYDITALTSLQLLAMVLIYQKDPTTLEHIQEILLNTRGVVEGYEWTDIDT